MQIPQVGFGTYLAKDAAKLKAALHYVIEECGVRHIDCAWAYFNQEVVGEALKEIFAKGKIKREDLFITSKLWNTHHRPDLVAKEIRDTLKQLQLDYLDLWLMHWPIAFQSREDNEFIPKDDNGKILYEAIDIIDTWKAMEQAVDDKLTRFIGVSNFSIEQLERLRFNSRIQPYANQVECHLYRQNKPLLDYCEQHGIYLMCHTTIGHPPLKGYKDVKLIEDPVVVEVAKEVGKTPAQVAIRFLVQKSKYYTVIPMSMNPVNIKSNADVNFTLSETQMKKLDELDRYYSFYNMADFFGVDVLGLGLNRWGQ